MDAVRKISRDKIRHPRAEVFIEKAASPGSPGCELAFPGGREFKGGPDIFPRQSREVPQDIVLRHPASQILEDVVHGDARALDARFAAADGGVNDDAILVGHLIIVTPATQGVQGSKQGMVSRPEIASPTISNCLSTAERSIGSCR